ncbi:TatD family hydrolase [Glaciecola sp. KUL10]|uniref:TatD family hydrolase n=1 Tax=Glaciecola sp. (strain KUL10) TaxID=2161813 RepID=UPI000D786B31|nr:TatD family hydrolase [Glaciecola sp. KUL10]
MIDSHCHLDLPIFDNDRNEVLQRAKALGLTKCLLPGLSLKQFRTLLTLKAQEPCYDICLGLHPYFLRSQSPHETQQTINVLNKLADEHKDKIVAIGETGLDSKITTNIEYQKILLKAQIEIAERLNKPLVLHHRQSHNELIRLLKQAGFSNGGVIHAFSGSDQIAQTYIQMGFYLGVGGTITYERAKKTRETIKHIGLQYLLLETDSPDMPMCGKQGLRNEPAYLIDVIATLSKLKACSETSIIQTTTNNYNNLFSGELKR